MASIVNLLASNCTHHSSNKRKARACELLVDLRFVSFSKYDFHIHEIQERKK